MSRLRRNRWDIFLSYSHHDSDRAVEMAGTFAQEGFSCWLDQDQLRASVAYDQEILKVIRQSSVVVALISRQALESRYVNHEVSSALGAGAPVVQCHLEDIPQGELKEPFNLRLKDPAMGRVHVRFLHNEKTRAEQFPRLISDLRTLTRFQRIGWWLWPALGTAGFVAVIAVLLLSLNFVMRRTLTDILIKDGPPRPNAASKARLQAATFTGGGATIYQPPDAADSSDLLRPDFVFDVAGLRANGSKWEALTADSRLATGDYFFIRTETFTPGYLYVFLLDAAGTLQWIFPKNDAFALSAGTNPVAARAVITLPTTATKAYKLDDAVGIESVIAIFSATPWPDLEQALREGSQPAASGGSASQVLLALNTVAKKGKGIAQEAPVQVDQQAAPVTRAAVDGQSPVPVVFAPMRLRAQEHWVRKMRQFNHVAKP